MINLSNLIHHPVTIEAHKKIETKLPYPHTLDDRIKELEQFKVDYQDDPAMVDFIGRVIAVLKTRSSEEYDLHTQFIGHRNNQVTAEELVASHTSYFPEKKVNTGKWIVQKHPVGGKHLEIAVVVEGSHGTKSYGWHDNVEKIIILADQHVSNQRPYSEAMFELAMKEAQELCERLNKEDPAGSTLLKNMGIISGGRFAAMKSDIPSFNDIITSGGYSPEEMSGALYLCWYREFAEMHRFPEEYRKRAATVLVDLSETIIEFRGQVNNIEELYDSSIQAGFDDNLYPIEVKVLLEENAGRHYLILKATTGRIVNSK